jgi:fluoroacetyl-CoA thioesterase
MIQNLLTAQNFCITIINSRNRFPAHGLRAEADENIGDSRGNAVKPTLAPGAAHKRSVTIDRARTIDFMGEELRVYATPELVRDIEVTCRELLLQHIDAGEDSVGTHVDVHHTGATLLGMPVEVTATIAEVKGRLVTFEVTAKDSVEQVAHGRHTRFVVDVAKTAERLAAKAAKAKAQ